MIKSCNLLLCKRLQEWWGHVGQNVRKCAQTRANMRAEGGKLCKPRVKLAHLARALCQFVSHVREPRMGTDWDWFWIVMVGIIGSLKVKVQNAKPKLKTQNLNSPCAAWPKGCGRAERRGVVGRRVRKSSSAQVLPGFVSPAKHTPRAGTFQWGRSHENKWVSWLGWAAVVY